jgi:hypothetical protein
VSHTPYRETLRDLASSNIGERFDSELDALSALWGNERLTEICLIGIVSRFDMVFDVVCEIAVRKVSQEVGRKTTNRSTRR